MPKKSFQTAPKPKKKPSSADIAAFEQGGIGHDAKFPHSHKPTFVAEKEKTKRLSIDLPASVHTRFKSACAAADSKMAQEVEQLIRQRCEELEAESKV